MTNYNPTFSVSDFELKDYTSPWLTPDQKTAVDLTESRVEEQLNFLAQMLGWNGPNYWTNLPTTVSQKRQLLGGSFGVFNSYVIPEIYEIRNWDDTIVVEKLEFIKPGHTVHVESVDLGIEEYKILDVKSEGDKYVISLGPLPDSFYQQIAAGVPLKINIPSSRPAPFYRPNVQASGDASFVCGNSLTDLILYPAWDTQKKFPYKFPILFAGSTYYFNQPLSLQITGSGTVIASQYNEIAENWSITIPSSVLTDPSGLSGTLTWPYANGTTTSPATLLVTIQSWFDPSDWGAKNVLDYFTGAWGNKGGALPFNLAFDSLDIHGFNEENSLYVTKFDNTLDFNNIVNLVYAQTSIVDDALPGRPYYNEFWWNQDTGVLAYWDTNLKPCEDWVEFNYRVQPTTPPPPEVLIPDVATFNASLPLFQPGTIVHISDINGLSIAENVLGLQGTITTQGSLTLYRADSSQYWTPSEFTFATEADFAQNAQVLPFKVPVVISDANGLTSVGTSYKVQNLAITVTGAYSATVQKYYNNTTWEIQPDSVLKYIANSGLFNGPYSGQMWWDYANPVPFTRTAAVYVSSPAPIASLAVVNPGIDLDNGVYVGVPLLTLNAAGGGGATVDITVVGNAVTSVVLNNPGNAYQQGDLLIPDPALYAGITGCVFEVSAALADNWVDVNTLNVIVGPPIALNMGVVLFYCNGELLSSGTPYNNSDFEFTYTINSATGKYEFSYIPKTLIGRTQFPKITISDNITTAYTADITNLVFSGYTIYMSPNVYDAESPLRLWKSQDLQDAETIAHLEEDNYINPLIADQNNGPGAENWEKYFVRLPLNYGRNETDWQKSALICQDFGYWGSTVDPERMNCPPEESEPAIYEELFLYDEAIPDYTYVYSEPYLYSNIGYYNNVSKELYQNAGIFPTTDLEFDEFDEANLIDYNPLHERQADVTSPVNQGYGDWKGIYVNINPCVKLTGHLLQDLLQNGVDPVQPPVWDASIYKFAPTCANEAASYNVDANHYKIGYAYFVADASAAEEGFFDPQQEAAWREPVTQPRTLYLTAR